MERAFLLSTVSGTYNPVYRSAFIIPARPIQLQITGLSKLLNLKESGQL